MRNRRSFFESQKESFIREAYENNPSDFVLNSVKFIERNSKDEALEESFSHIPGQSSSASIENKFRHALVSNIETVGNIISIKEEELRNNHRSYMNAFSNIANQYEQLEKDANRELLMLTDNTPFEYGVTDGFITQDNIDQDRSDAYWYNGQIMLAPKSFKRNNLNIKSMTTNIKVRGGSLKDVNELSNKRNVLAKDGSSFKLKAETSSPTATVELEIIIELNNSTRIDKLEIVSTAIESLEKESIRIIYSKDNATYLSPEGTDYERHINGFNTFDIYEDDVKVIKVYIQKNAADSFSSNINEYLFSIDYIGNVEYIYEETSTLYAGPYFIEDLDGNKIDFDMASLKTGTCCVVPDETVINFSISKDGENYIPISYFDEGNTVVEFKNQINENIFALTDSTKPDIIRKEDETYQLNRYLEEGTEFVENSLIVRRGINSWINGTRIRSTTIEIENIEGRFFDLGRTTLTVNGAEKTGMLFLSKGIYLISTSIENYEEIDLQNIINEEDLKAADRLYPYNHKYLFEGIRYPRSFIGNKKYLGVKSLFARELRLVQESTLSNDSNNKDIYALKYVNGVGTTILVNDGSSTEEVYLDCKSTSDFGNNEVYLKAVLTSTNQYKTPRIDAIQIRVI